MTDSAAPPNLADAERVIRRYGQLPKWLIAAVIAGTVWVVKVENRLSKMEDKVDAVVERLDPVRDALIRIQERLGIPPPADKPK